MYVCNIRSTEEDTFHILGILAIINKRIGHQCIRDIKFGPSLDQFHSHSARKNISKEKFPIKFIKIF